MYSRSWVSDFEFSSRGVLAKKTGRLLPLTHDLLRDFRRFLVFFFHVRLVCAPHQRGAFTVAFAPDRPRPWYLIWPVLYLAGARIISDTRNADLVMHFQDATDTRPHQLKTREGAKVWNFACRSIAKDNVARAFERAFGYPLSVNPQEHVGFAVEKAQANAAHDGRIIQCPAPRREGRSYQHLIDNSGGDGSVTDLRTTLVDGAPAIVFVKRRPIDQRFSNMNTSVYYALPAEIFSEAEMAQIAAFSKEVGLQWAGIDVLRDRRSGRLYIVDANKTDLGPPIGMPLRQKIDAVKLLAGAMRQAVLSAR